MVSRSSITCQLQLKISLMRALLKCIVWDGSHPGESPVRNNMYIFARTGDRYLAAIGLKICMMLQLSRMWVSSLFVAISLRVSKWGQIDFFRKFVFSITLVTCIIYNCPLMHGRAILQWDC